MSFIRFMYIIWVTLCEIMLVCTEIAMTENKNYDICKSSHQRRSCREKHALAKAAFFIFLHKHFCCYAAVMFRLNEYSLLLFKLR